MVFSSWLRYWKGSVEHKSALRRIRRRRPPARRHVRRLFLETLEDRTLLSTYLVAYTGDNGGVNPAPGAATGTLRQAIIDANAAQTGTAANPDLIQFDIPTTDSGYNSTTGKFTIQPLSALPTITDPVNINGYSQPGSTMNTLPGMGTRASDNADPLIVVDGSQAGAASDALALAAGYSTVQGLVLQNWLYANGIHLMTNGNDTINGNFFINVGGNVGGDQPGGAIFVDNVADNTIGGTTPQARNLLGFNGISVNNWASGIMIEGSGASGNTVEGNYIGTDGNQLLMNPQLDYRAVEIVNASNNIIGGTASGAGNVIDTSGLGAITIGNNLFSNVNGSIASGNLVQGNYIGLNSAGTAALLTSPQRPTQGVWILGNAPNNTVGGTTLAARNVISGWTDDVAIQDEGTGQTPTGDLVEGNFIGTNAAGTAALGQSFQGIITASDDIIGGTAPGAGNLISGAQIGVEVGGNGNQVQGNLIGTDATGTQSIPNGFGVHAVGNNVIGGTTPGAGNTIAFNDGPGVVVDGTGVAIEGNSIHGNSGAGVETPEVGPGHVTGDQIDANSIYSNVGPGVWVQSDPFGSADPFGGFSDGLATGISIRDNSIYGNSGLGITLGTTAVDVNGNPLTLQQVQDNFQSNPNLWDHDEPSNTVILNDSLAHVGANNYQNFPVLTSASSSSTDTSISGTFSEAAEPNTMIHLDFYANPTADPSGFGQGQTYLGYTNVTTDANGDASFTTDLAVNNLAGQWITATATDPFGNTSQFSADVPILAPNETFAQFLQGVLPHSSTQPNALTIVVGSSTMPDTVINAVNALTNVTQSVTIVLDLGGGTYSVNGAVANPPPNVTFKVQNGTLDPDYPALTVAGGQVVVSNCTLTSSGNTPTLLVTGGIVTLSNDTISQTSTTSFEPAISVTGGTVNLGTATSPGNNTLSVSNSGDLVSNTSGNAISAVGDTFTVNGATLAPDSLSGIVFKDFNDDGQVDFGEQGIVGVAIALTGTDFLGNAVSLSTTTDSDGAYIFANLQPGTYSITETQPAGYNQGINTVGTAGGSLTATDQFSVWLGQDSSGLNGLNYNFGEQPQATGSVQNGQTAGIGFWNNKNGQALIQSFNGGPMSTQLAAWLADTLPHIFGVDAGNNALIHADGSYLTNTEVAARFQQDFVLKGVKLDAQVLATALSVYATNATLDNTGVATNYGFLVSGVGVGTAGVNVGSYGDAFGVANNTVLTVLDLLKATDAQAVDGLLYNGDAVKRKEANSVYGAINDAGNIN